MTRLTLLKSAGAVVLLPACAARSGNVLRVGSTDSPENTIIAEIFAGALEQSGIALARRMRLGDEATAMAALERGDIDVLPAHARTGSTANGLAWLAPAPADDAR